MSSIYASYGSWKYQKSTVKERASQIILALQELAETVQYDGIALTGSSGVWLGGLLQAHDLWREEVPILLVRKSGENSHGPLVESDLGPREAPTSVVLVDDFISSGATLDRVVGSLAPLGIKVSAVLEHEYVHADRRLQSTGLKHGIPRFSRREYD